MAGQTDTRAWTDRRRQRHGALDANGNPQYNEIGRNPVNLNFGIPGAAARIADGLPRPSNWEESVSVQHELFPRVSVTGGYYRRQFYDIQFTTESRRSIPIANYTPFTIIVPDEPEHAGRRRPGHHAVQPERAGRRATTSPRGPTTNTRVYNGFEMSVNARLPTRLHLRRDHDRAVRRTDNCTDLTNSNPNNRGDYDRRSATRSRRSRTLYKASAGFTVCRTTSRSADRSRRGPASASGPTTRITARPRRRRDWLHRR